MEIEQLYKMSQQLEVLYVEDDVVLSKNYETFLKKFFKKVDVAKDGQEGIDRYIEYFNQNNSYYDLVITDIQMPKMNGIEMSREILNFNHEQQIIIVSAYNDSDKLQSLMDLGITYFILKPINFQDIIKILDKACSYITRVKENKKKVEERDKLIERLQEESLKIEHDRKLYEHDLQILTALLDDYEISSIVDRNGIILSVNKKFEEIFKYSASSIVGTSYKDMREAELIEKLESVMQDEEVFRGEVKTLVANNSEKWIWTELIVVPIIEINKEVTYHFIERDITEKKQADALVAELSEFQEVSFNFEGI